MNLLLIASVLLPAAAGILIRALPAFRERRARQGLLMAALILNLLLTLAVCLGPELRLELLHLSDRLPILFKADDFGRLFSLLSAVMFLLAGIFSLDYMKHEANEERFYLFYLIVLGMLNGIAWSGNLVTLYLFFECMTLLSMPLVLHTMSKEAIAAAFKYLFYSIAGASLALTGIFYAYTYGGTLEFTPGGVLDAAAVAGHETALLVVSLLTVVGFGAKAGMVPLHAWLSVAHPVAPAPASAILSGVITKAGIVAAARYVFHIAGAGLLRGSWMQTAWMALALLTVLMGSTLAFKEPLFKKRLAYSSVSQVSYVMFGLATMTGEGVLGALLQVVFHSIIKDGLFLSAGAVICKTGKTAVSQLRGIGKEMPITLWCFTLGGIALVGIPPTGGFLSKWYLATGSLSADTGVFTWLGPAVLLLSALLTAGYLLTITVRGFFPGSDFDYTTLEKREAGPLMTVPMAILAAASLILGMLPGPLMSFLQRIASSMV